MDNEDKLIAEMATLNERVENLSKIILAFIERVKAQDERIKQLETSKTRVVTTIALVATGMGIFVFAGNAYMGQVVNQKIQETDFIHLLCKEYKAAHPGGDELPRLCQ